MLDTSLHPADELAEIRQMIRRLEAREAELLEGFRVGELPSRGQHHEVNVRTRIERVFQPERLPEALFQDPDLWQDREVSAVVVRDRALATA